MRGQAALILEQRLGLRRGAATQEQRKKSARNQAGGKY
jgi:hypothetical protein